MRHHGWIRHLIKDFEYNHLWQFRFHLVMMIFWIANAAIGTAVLILWPAEWVKVGVFYVFLLSIYANWDTDYDAVSASQAALHAQAVLKDRGGTDDLTEDQ